MDVTEARERLDQLYSYSQDTAKVLGVPFELSKKNNYGPFAEGKPIGGIMHYTASNAAYSKKRPYGRYPVLRQRFARGGRQGVGIHFIVWDCHMPRFAELKDRYPLLDDLPTEVAFMGDDLAFWHAGAANRWSYGIEIRNIGQLTKSGQSFFWSKGRNRYNGREPIQVGNSYWEPYTRAQMSAVLWINRTMSALHPIQPERLLGHTHISNTRIDPGPHFPIHEIRKHSLDDSEQYPSFLNEFYDEDPSEREDPMISEIALSEGLYRHDWDGVPNDWDEDYGTAPVNNVGEVYEHKNILRSLGYYVDGDLDDVVAIFRSRWKKRRASGRGWENMIPIAGGMDKQAQDLVKIMARQWDRL